MERLREAYGLALECIYDGVRECIRVRLCEDVRV